MTNEELIELLNSDEAVFADKALNYLDGTQKKYVIQMLDDPDSGRKNWRKKGRIPRYRNITKMIIEKSGLLFADTAPIINVYSDDPNNIDEDQSAKLQELLEDLEWIEFFNNFDSVVRLLKTAMVHVQYDTETNSIILDTLHRGNSVVVTNVNNNEVSKLIHKITESTVRITTKEFIEDYAIDRISKKPVRIGMIPNAFGIIPIAKFYDVQTPRTGFWVPAPEDLIDLNDIYNFHIMDSEYASAWAKMKTLVTNAVLTGGAQQMELQEVAGQTLPKNVPSQAKIAGGPDSTVVLSAPTGESIYFEYKGPDGSGLVPADDLINKWVRDWAADWSVRIKAEGQGQADSGFKLVVEEMDNLDLRKRRSRMMEAGFSRLFEVIKVVKNYTIPGYFSDDSKLSLKFTDPKLPVDKKSEEDLWTQRINEKRATPIDYFMNVYGLNKEEARNRYDEINDFYNEGQTNETVVEVDSEDSEEPEMVMSQEDEDELKRLLKQN